MVLSQQKNTEVFAWHMNVHATENTGHGPSHAEVYARAH